MTASAINANSMSAANDPMNVTDSSDLVILLLSGPSTPPMMPGYGPMDVRPFFEIDDGRLLNQLPVWAPDAALRKAILVENPARLYGFT